MRINSMEFKNENTFQTFLDHNQESRFHRLFEKAVDLVSSEFGKTYPIIVNGKKIYTQDTMVRRSPTDTRITLGYMCKGRPSDAKKSIQAANNVFQKWSMTGYEKRVKLF